MEAEILDIQKRYGRKEVLRGTSFRVAAGSCLGILGANGSGKSTLLKILAGVLRPKAGRFLWQGEDLLRNPRLRASQVAYVPQGTPLIEELSARDNLRLWYEPEALARSLDGGVLRQLGLHAKPIALLNTAGFYDGLATFLQGMTEQGFAGREVPALVSLCGTPEEALRALTDAPQTQAQRRSKTEYFR